MNKFQRPQHKPKPDLQIVICTHNRAALLAKALASLNRAKRPSGCQIEIMVIANACTDNTAEVLGSYKVTILEKAWLPMRGVQEPILGKSHALNRAIRLITAPIVAFVDDDHLVDADYLIGIYSAVQTYPEATLFCGRILPDWDGSEPRWVHDVGRYRIYPLPVPCFDEGDKPKLLLAPSVIPGGGNIFLRCEIFERVGNYAPDFGPVGHDLGGAEDMEWVKRALSVGARLQYVPNVVQYHYVDQRRLTLSYLIRKAYARSANAARLSEAARSQTRVPLYIIAKIGRYLGLCLMGFTQRRRRHYLMRLAASTGELRGFIQASRNLRKKGNGRL